MTSRLLYTSFLFQTCVLFVVCTKNIKLFFVFQEILLHSKCNKFRLFVYSVRICSGACPCESKFWELLIQIVYCVLNIEQNWNTFSIAVHIKFLFNNQSPKTLTRVWNSLQVGWISYARHAVKSHFLCTFLSVGGCEHKLARSTHTPASCTRRRLGQVGSGVQRNGRGRRMESSCVCVWGESGRNRWLSVYNSIFKRLRTRAPSCWTIMKI